MEDNEKIKVLYIDTGFSSNWGGSKSLVNMVNSVRNDINPLVLIASKKIDDKLLQNNKIPYKHFKIGTIKNSFSVKPISKILSYPFKVISSIYNNIYFIKKLCDVIKQNDINIVHSNTSIFYGGLIAAKICKVKHVWHLREFQTEQTLYPFIGFSLFKKLLKKSNAVICITKAIQEAYQNKESYILYDAVINSDNIPTEVKEKDNYILFCGQLSKNKGIEDAIKAFVHISDIYPDLKLKIAGTGPLEKKLKEYTIKNALLDKIEFLGYVENVFPLFQKAKAFLMTSKNEALGRTTIEAMLSNCIVIGRNTGGTSELIQNAKTGLLFNNIDELVQAIHSVLKEEVNISEITKNAKKFAIENFTEEKFKFSLLKIYKSLFN